MKYSFKRFLSIVAIAMVMCSVPLYASEELTVDMALKLAYENNPVLKASQSRIEQARQQIAEASASKLPQIGVTLASQFMKDATEYPVYSPAGNQIGVAAAGYRNTYQAALNLSWLLYSSGAVQNNVAAKEQAFMGVKAQEVRTDQGIESGVKNAYYNLQRARAKLIVARETLELTKEHLSQVESFYKYGVVAKDQVLRVQVDVSSGKLGVISSENAVAVGWRSLERSVGAPLKDIYVLPEPENSVEDHSVPDSPEVTAMEMRPELVALDYSRQSALSLAKAASGSRGPQVYFTGELSDTDDSFLPSGNDSWKVTLSANWQFYDGGESLAKERQARAAAMEVIHNLDDLKKQITLEISSGKLNLESALQRIEVARDQVTSAEEDYRMAMKRYKANVGTNIDVLDSRVALSDARTQLVDAVYDTYSARAELEYAMGVSSEFTIDREKKEKEDKPEKK